MLQEFSGRDNEVMKHLVSLGLILIMMVLLIYLLVVMDTMVVDLMLPFLMENFLSYTLIMVMEPLRMFLKKIGAEVVVVIHMGSLGKI